MPRDSHLFRECNDKIEELVLSLTLPLYFALSGLKTDVTQINTGAQGAMVVLVCFVATVGKVIYILFTIEYTYTLLKSFLTLFSFFCKLYRIIIYLFSLFLVPLLYFLSILFLHFLSKFFIFHALFFCVFFMSSMRVQGLRHISQE